MKKWKSLTALMLGFILMVGSLPLGKANAATIQPLPFDVFINNTQVPFQNALLYKGHTYVKLRDVAAATNMDIEFNAHHQMPLPGGARHKGINIDVPTFVYTDPKVPDYNHEFKDVGDGTYFTGVDITSLYFRYVDTPSPNKNLKYVFKDNTLVIHDGELKKVETFRLHPSMGKYYVPVPDFKEHIQPYLIDICMQG